MYAVISDRGRQLGVRVGDVVVCDEMDEPAGAKVVFERVLLLSREGEVRVGEPTVEGVRVEGEVVGGFRGEKSVIFRFKRRKNVRVKNGHRQDYVRVRITDITT